MRLWTIMPESTYNDTIVATGHYHCDTAKCAMLNEDSPTRQFAHAYGWLENYMTEHIGPAPENIKHPVWAWFRIRNKEKRPDLRWMEFNGFREPMVMIELEIEDDKVILSDECKWTCAQLNNSAWCDTDEELDWYYDDPSVTWKEKEKFKNKSWLRIFDISESENVQATFWEFDTSNIKNIWHFNKNPRV